MNRFADFFVLGLVFLTACVQDLGVDNIQVDNSGALTVEEAR